MLHLNFILKFFFFVNGTKNCIALTERAHINWGALFIRLYDSTKIRIYRFYIFLVYICQAARWLYHPSTTHYNSLCSWYYFQHNINGIYPNWFSHKPFNWAHLLIFSWNRITRTSFWFDLICFERNNFQQLKKNFTHIHYNEWKCLDIEVKI